MTTPINWIAEMARKTIISHSPLIDCYFLIVDFRTPEGRRYDLCYSSTTPGHALLQDLKGILPEESLTEEDCECIIETWAEMATSSFYRCPQCGKDKKSCQCSEVPG